MWSGCKGTPNQYSDFIKHTVCDSGGIFAHGTEAFQTSRRHDLYDVFFVPVKEFCGF
jgi:hypothetical protein